MNLQKAFLQILASLLLTAMLFSCSGSNSDPVSSEGALSKTSAFDDPGFYSKHLGGGFRHLKMIGEVLELSEQQKEQIKNLLEAQHNEFGKEAWVGSREDRKAARQEKREKIHAQILDVLTPEQRTKAEKFEAQLKNGEVPQEFIDKHVERLTEKLNLSSEQQQQVRELAENSKFLAFKGKTENRREMRKQKKQLRQETHEKLMQILTPEQQTIFEQMQEERHAKMREHRSVFRRHRQEQQLNRLSAMLELDDDQKSQLTEILEEAHSDRKERFQDRERGSREEMKDQMKAKRQETHRKIKSILTEEQLVIFKEHEERMKERHRDF